MADFRIVLRAYYKYTLYVLYAYCCCIYYCFVCGHAAKGWVDISFSAMLWPMWPITRIAIPRLFWTCSTNTVTHPGYILRHCHLSLVFLFFYPPLNGRRVFLTNIQHTAPHNKVQSPLPPQHHHHPFLLPWLSLCSAYPKTLKHCVLWYLLLGLNWKNNIQQTPAPASFYKSLAHHTNLLYIYTGIIKTIEWIVNAKGDENELCWKCKCASYTILSFASIERERVRVLSVLYWSILCASIVWHYMRLLKNIISSNEIRCLLQKMILLIARFGIIYIFVYFVENLYFFEFFFAERGAKAI